MSVVRPLKRCAWLAAAAVAVSALAVGLATFVGAAGASTSTKYYSAAIAPATAGAGATQTHTLTLRNSASSTQTLGSADFTIPTDKGFTVASPAAGQSMSVLASDGKRKWTITNASGRVLQFRAVSSGDALAPAQHVAAAVVVATSCTATTGTWTTVAKQANNFNGPPGNDFVREGSDPVLSVSGGGSTAARLEFTAQPSRTEAGEAISPAVAVTAYDACGNVATHATGNVTVAIGDDPSAGAATLGGTTTQPLSSGVATFAGLSIDTSGRGYSLSAHLASLNDESDSFDVVDELCTADELAPSDQYCQATDGAGTTVRTTRPPADASMAFTFSDLGTVFTCSRRDATTTTRSTIGAQVTLDPLGYLAPIDLTFIWDGIVPQGGGVANFVFCLSKDGGLSYFEVPLCNKRATNLPCELSRNATGVATMELKARIAAADPIGSLG